ncbi:MAG: CRISPR-associated endonuclease Cas3'' [Bacteriovoracaceae bacterium]
MLKEFVAHVKKNKDESWAEPHLLENHLNDTAKKTGEFTSLFGNKDWGELLGYWHDLGKFHPAWQKYLSKETGYNIDAHIENFGNRPNHSTAGAVLVIERLTSKFSSAAKLLAYAIAGHHAGLADWYPDEAGGNLSNRLYKESNILNTDDLDVIRNLDGAKQFIDKPSPQTIPSIYLRADSKEKFRKASESIHLWVRMLFSSLVDADFLDTERYMNPEQFEGRGNYLSIFELKKRFNSYMDEKKSNSEINKVRNEILEQCRSKAKSPSGFFSLTVPTGGGKTLSSMAFALGHAEYLSSQTGMSDPPYGARRIIMAIPYTSIIEQTAKVFKYGTDNDEEIVERKKTGKVLFGEDQVIEHHSNLDPEKENYKNRLASENWDAPIIVTTNVQLFESLFASKTSSCRKLHNLVNSIIILDEAQMLPPEYLKPILAVLKGLTEHFGVTVVFMTATQPALEGTIGSDANKFEGISNVTPIIDNPELLTDKFKRVEILLPKDFNVRSEWEEIASELLKYEQVLCIVNTRSDCRKLHSLMPEGTIHLSAFMCGEERSEIISEIKRKPREKKSIRVISTQLVEAGVDIDFPVVYRALAGLDSIAQAAGRCNRENKLAEEGKLGKVIVFNPPKPAPVGLLRKGEDACKSILRSNSTLELTPALYTNYFKYLYSNLNTFDESLYYERLVKDAADFTFQFRTYSHNFNMIDSEGQRSIVVLYESKKTGNNSEKLINELKHADPSKYLSRKLQRFIVNVPIRMFERIQAMHYIEPIHDYWVQSDSILYKPGLGLLGNDNDWIIGNGIA